MYQPENNILGKRDGTIKYIATYDIHLFLLVSPNFHVFSAFSAND